MCSSDLNRGVLPWHRIGRGRRCVRVLVPLAAGESLWVGWMVRAGVQVSGRSAAGQAVHVHPVTQPQDGWTLLMADSLATDAGSRPLDAESLPPASSPEQRGESHLCFTVTDASDREIGRVGVTLATPQLYQALSGRAPPPPTTADDAYKGWRLP